MSRVLRICSAGFDYRKTQGARWHEIWLDGSSDDRLYTGHPNYKLLQNEREKLVASFEFSGIPASVAVLHPGNRTCTFACASMRVALPDSWIKQVGITSLLTHEVLRDHKKQFVFAALDAETGKGKQDRALIATFMATALTPGWAALKVKIHDLKARVYNLLSKVE